MIKKLVVLLTFICGVVVSEAVALSPELISDINQMNDPGGISTSSSYPSYLSKLGGSVFFVADDGIHGRELWRSDGTPAGTKLVKDIVPGPASGIWVTSIASTSLSLPVAGDKLFFTAATPETGIELWVSDGTEAGTRLVKDLYPGRGSTGIDYLTPFGSKVYFRATTPDTGTELCSSDGTPDGTSCFDLMPGPGGIYPVNLTAGEHLLYFRGMDADHGYELWRSDGTLDGTFRVSDIRPGPDSSWGYQGGVQEVALGDALFFIATESSNQYQGYYADGTLGGVTKIAGNYMLSIADVAASLSSADGLVLFRASPIQYGYTSPSELWIIDPATSFATQLGDFLGRPDLMGESFLGASNHILYFTARDYTNYSGGSISPGLWSADRKTGLVQQILSNINILSIVTDFREIGGTAFFRVGLALDDPKSGYWMTDGTMTGTLKLDNGDAQFSPLISSNSIVLNGNLLFRAPSNKFGVELFSINYDKCPLDNNKLGPAICGCGVEDSDLNGNGQVDCGDPSINEIPPAPQVKVGKRKIVFTLPKFDKVEYQLTVKGLKVISKTGTRITRRSFSNTIEIKKPAKGKWSASYRIKVGVGLTPQSLKKNFAIR